MYKDWTKEETEKLIELRKNGKSWYEISNILGRTKEAVRRRYRDLIAENKISKEDMPNFREFKEMIDRRGRKITFWTQDMVKELVKMKLNGHTWKEIGKALGVTAKAAEEKYRDVINSKLKDVLYLSEIFATQTKNYNISNELIDAYRHATSALINKPYNDSISNILAAEKYFLKYKNKNGFVELIKTIKNSKDVA